MRCHFDYLCVVPAVHSHLRRAVLRGYYWSRNVKTTVVALGVIILASCSRSDNADLAKARAEAKVAQTEATKARAELKKAIRASAKPTVTPDTSVTATEAEVAHIDAEAKAKTERKADEEAKQKAIDIANSKLSRANYNKIQPTIYLPDVVAMLGPSSSEVRSGDFLVVTWRSNPTGFERPTIITVRFRGAPENPAYQGDVGRINRWYYNGVKSFSGP